LTGQTVNGVFALTDLYFAATGGNNIYTFTDQQTVDTGGTATYTKGGKQSLVNHKPEVLANCPNGVLGCFEDGPGLVSPIPQGQTTAGAKVVSATAYWILSLQVTVTSGDGQVVQCPTVDWIVFQSWSKGFLGPKVKTTVNVLTQPLQPQ
jgi:hypothetical protein